MKTAHGDARPKASRKVQDRKAPSRGWLSTDEEEVERRVLRAATEPFDIRVLHAPDGFHGDYAVRSGSGQPYRVEIRTLNGTDNSCDCPDFRKNGLGTCKHIETVRLRLRKKGRRRYGEAAQAGSPFVEVYLSRRGEPVVRVRWPASVPPGVHALVSPFFTAGQALLADPADAVPALTRAVASAPPAVRDCVRIARDVDEWAAELRRRREQQTEREQFLADVKAGKRSLDVVKAKLLPYQVDGLLHLAFGRRAMLADEMGLGKTIQAIAACVLLRQTRRIGRVLVVSPVSLKGEWEEQIARFTDLPSRIVVGPRAARLRQYRDPPFFTLCNYEQAVADVADLNGILAPDVVILDEAQRIKNWQTRTARSIKRLASPCAFVLTGTPLENRIDEVYSIAEFLDPAIFGSLFRFNREFYDLDDRGRPAGYRNLDELHRRLRPIMLRRRKEEVEDQIPPRTDKNFFVGMAEEQAARYEEYKTRVAKLVMISLRRPLTREEFEKLQKWLACMRMLCDTPYILDPECRLCPKLDELQPVLEEVLAAGENKAIVFSEWERMLELVRELAAEMGVPFAWHTGSVPQMKRRDEIRRFKDDPSCRLFLSTDSGATGLNLQAANVVVNLDLPWNPAKLEQRIARAWRKHQTRSVRVINLVTEDSIEHRMLGLLAGKRQLADGVLDGRGDLARIRMPSGRAAMVERLQSLMGAPPAAAPAVAPAPPSKPATPPYEALREDLVSRLGTRLLMLQSHETPGGRPVALAVVEGAADQVAPWAERLVRERFAGADAPPKLELLDRSTYETIQRLIAAGMLRPDERFVRIWHREGAVDAEAKTRENRRREAAMKHLAEARRKGRMAELLAGNGFTREAVPPVAAAVEEAVRAAWVFPSRPGDATDLPTDMPAAEIAAAFEALQLPESTVALIVRLRAAARGPELEEKTAAALLAEARALLAEIDRALTARALG